MACCYRMINFMRSCYKSLKVQKEQKELWTRIPLQTPGDFVTFGLRFILYMCWMTTKFLQFLIILGSVTHSQIPCCPKEQSDSAIRVKPSTAQLFYCFWKQSGLFLSLSSLRCWIGPRPFQLHSLATYF